MVRNGWTKNKIFILFLFLCNLVFRLLPIASARFQPLSWNMVNILFDVLQNGNVLHMDLIT